MFPFRDHNPSRKTPYVTWGLIGLNILIFLLYSPMLAEPARLAAFFGDWAMVPAEISSGQEPFTLISSMFLHGGLMHLAGNMLFLYIYGDNIEDQLGHIPFLIFYLAAGLGADAIHVLSDPYSNVPTVGASGAIAGVMGAYLLLFPRAKIDFLVILVVIFKVFTLPAFVVLGFWMVLQIFGGFNTPSEGGGVAYWAHIGGFITGLLLIAPKWLSLGGPDFWRRTDFHPPHKETFATRTTNIPVVRRRK